MKKGNISNKIVSLVIVLLVLVVFISVNILAGLINDSYDIKVDLTKSQILEFSPITMELIDKLEKDDSIEDASVKVISIIPEKMRDSSMDEYGVINSSYSIIEKFASSSSKISFEKIDPKSNPKIFEKYKKDSGDAMDDTSIIVEYKEKYRILGPDDLARLFYDGTLLLKTEQSLSSAIDFTVYGKKINIYITSGHGESITVHKLQETYPYLYADIASIDLKNAPVPSNADLLIINPSDDFTISEISAIDSYMNKGGNAMIIYDGHSPDKSLPNIMNYLSEWGVTYINGYVAENDDAYHADTPYELLPRIQDHDIVSAIKSADRRIMCTNTTAMKTFNTKSTSVTPLLITSSQSFVSYSTEEDAEIVAKGPFTIACIAERTLDKTNPAQMVFVGGSDIFESQYNVNSAFANADYISNCIKYITSSSSLLSVSPKNITAIGMDISQDQSQKVLIVTVIVIPAAFVLIGLAVWIRRRKL